jgi:hypothetical protein
LPEKKHTRNKKKSINDTGYNDPLKKPVFLNKPVGFSPGLNCYDNFFQQSLKLRGKYKEREWEVVSGKWGEESLIMK